MSADNFYLVVPNPKGGFSPVMGFASDDDEAELVPRADAPVFDTPEAALSSVVCDYAEYGHSISPACYPEGRPDPVAELAAVRGQLARAEADLVWLHGAVRGVESAMRAFAASPHMDCPKDVLAFANLLAPLGVVPG